MASITPRRNAAGRITSWRVQVRHPNRPPRHASAPTRKEALAIARRLEYEVELSGPAATREMTIAELVDRQIASADGPAGLPGSKRTSLGHIRYHLGHRPVGELTVKDITSFARTRHRNGGDSHLSPATIAMDIGYLRDLLDYGANEEGTAHRLTELVLARRALRKAGLIAKARTVSRLPSDDEFLAILGSAAENRTEIPLRHVLRFLRATGLREGEALRILWKDLDEQRRVLLIPRRKHPKAPRDKELPLLPNHGIDPLEELRLIRGLGPLRREAERNDGRVLPFAKGSIGAAMRRACRRAGIQDIRLHDLRHDAITAHVRKKKLSLPYIMLISGHDDVHSLIRYTHLTADDVVTAGLRD